MKEAEITEEGDLEGEAILEGALRYVRRELETKRGVPRTPGGSETRFVILGLGKLGGEELFALPPYGQIWKEGKSG